MTMAAVRRSVLSGSTMGVVVVNGRSAGRVTPTLAGLPGICGQVFGFIGGGCWRGAVHPR